MRIGRVLTVLALAFSLTVPVALLLRPPDASALHYEDSLSFERSTTRAAAAGKLLPEAATFVLLAGSGLSAFWLLLARQRRARAFGVAAVGITLADLFFAGGALTTSPAYWEQGRPLAEFVQARDPYARIFSTGGDPDVVSRLGEAMPAEERVFASSGESDLSLGLQRTEDVLAALPFERILRLAATRWLV